LGSSNYALLIPTLNRPEFIIRLLTYYLRKNFAHRILIGDSSTREKFEQANKFILQINDRLDIEHYHYPGLSNYSVTCKLARDANTEYASYLPDDDFLVPESIEKLILFLSDNEEYVVAWGRTAMFRLDRPGLFGEVSSVAQANAATAWPIKNESGKERLLQHIETYSSAFIGVCRTKALSNALRNSEEISDLTSKTKEEWATGMLLSEVITSFSLAAQGKIGSLDCLHWIRQEHAERYTGYGTDTEISTKIYPKWWRISVSQIAEDLRLADNLTTEESLDESIKFFTKYFFVRGKRQSQQKHKVRAGIWPIGSQFVGRLIVTLREIRLLVFIVKKGRQMMGKTYRDRNPLSLQSLIHSESKYYRDFSPVYDLVTARRTDN
jgi:glycosyltransferase domain-containing protein